MRLQDRGRYALTKIEKAVILLEIHLERMGCSK